MQFFFKFHFKWTPSQEQNTIIFSVFSVQVPEIVVKSLKSDIQEMWPLPELNHASRM
jgi:hypothetical protein